LHAEEVEEYEPHVVSGSVVFAGVDYAEILEKAALEADVILWDGGNNDFPFYRPTLHVVVADPSRLGNELSYYPGEVNLRMADVVVINKVDAADLATVQELRHHIRFANPRALIVEAASPVRGDRPDLISGRKVLVIEDGPTLTHGEMRFGAGTILARKFAAARIVDPRPYAVGSIAHALDEYPRLIARCRRSVIAIANCVTSRRRSSACRVMLSWSDTDRSDAMDQDFSSGGASFVRVAGDRPSRPRRRSGCLYPKRPVRYHSKMGLGGSNWGQPSARSYRQQRVVKRMTTAISHRGRLSRGTRCRSAVLASDALQKRQVVDP
jgi:hypothetical protein